MAYIHGHVVRFGQPACCAISVRGSKFARTSTKIIARPRHPVVPNTRETNRLVPAVTVHAFPFCRILAIASIRYFPFVRSREPPVNRIESTIFVSRIHTSRHIPLFTTRTITRKFCAPRNTLRPVSTVSPLIAASTPMPKCRGDFCGVTRNRRPSPVDGCLNYGVVGFADFHGLEFDDENYIWLLHLNLTP